MNVELKNYSISALLRQFYTDWLSLDLINQLDKSDWKSFYNHDVLAFNFVTVNITG